MKVLGEKSYVHFSIAASIYVVGVVVFSFWSYRTHRNMMLAHTDTTLKNAAFTAREILAPATSLSNPSAYTLHQKQLDRLAQNGGFIAITAVARHKNETRLLIRGASDTGKPERNHIPLPHGIGKQILKLAQIPEKDFATLTIEHPDFGQLRMTILYDSQDPESGIAYLAAKAMGSINELLRKQVTRKTMEGLLLIIMAIPLIALYGRSQKKTTEKLTALNTQLQEEIELQKLRETELTDAMLDLKRFSSVAAGRESRIIELKNEINELLIKHTHKKRYDSHKTK